MKFFFLFLLLLPAFLFGQMRVLNSSQTEIMRVDNEGITTFRTSNAFGHVNIDALGPVYPFQSIGGGTAYAQSCLYIDTKENVDHNTNATKYVGLHVITSMSANPSIVGLKQDIAVAAQLLSSDRSKLIGSGNLAINWAHDDDDPNRRDVALVVGVISDANSAAVNGDIRRLCGVEGRVKRENNTTHPEVVYAGYFSGAKTFIQPPLLIGKESLSTTEEEMEVMIYNDTPGKAANLCIKGAGDDQRFSQIQLGKINSEVRWLINYHNPGSNTYNENLTFTYYNGSVYERWLTVSKEGYVGINMETIPLKSVLHVRGMPVYDSNSAATAAGLTSGAFYRTSGGDVRIVY
ncbi:hypothetical protein JW935_03820 [candidate division KSB1 bacterium]|nr:hypothetical protein [candidate division KSB1 bacterium]